MDWLFKDYAKRFSLTVPLYNVSLLHIGLSVRRTSVQRRGVCIRQGSVYYEKVDFS